ncbi:MAG TPA: tetratricopeptide repeat protein [Candidatus Polarisedimenticolia bacterium]|nr:tetratricopeptide repeat protein [Candidatus Polarisedimenticolia bacterium]
MAEETPERWRRIFSIFEEALELPPGKRAEYLDAACGEDADLKTRVSQLLESSSKPSGILDEPLLSPAAPFLDSPPQPTSSLDSSSESASPGPPGSGLQPGGSLGPYRLLRKIGEGGMGEVWLAGQTAPLRRQVALKLIKAGMDTRQVVARFEAERQALARMDHPAIARVFEAGETPRGAPYFVMEYVEGERITAYCDRERLSTRDRLELFMRVCEGVQHAHQKGVIHRDLKPSNVLVAIQDGKPIPKIIDFGVAKATGERLTERTMFTERGVLIGTPEYMSPEQADLGGPDTDTRTDVYALGVLLYRLLVGALPFDPQDLRQAGFDEILRRIREVDPPRPSTRISSMGEASTEAAKSRRTEPGKLASQLRGDLDWITMKALEKDRRRRYGSPSEMAADISRHLRDEPILAGPPGAGYRAGKFIRRHRAGVTFAALVLIGLAGFAVVMAVQARRIARERNRAARVSEFLTGLFKVSDPGEARGNSVTAREILDRGVDKIEKDLSKEPEVQAQLMMTMGNVYTNLGLYRKAEPLLEKSVETRRRLLGEKSDETLVSMHNLAFLYGLQSRYSEAEKLYAHVLVIRRALHGENHRDTLFSMSGLAQMTMQQGRLDEAEKIMRRVLEARRASLGEDHPEAIGSLHDLAILTLERRRYPEAEKLYREVLERYGRILGEDHPFTMATMQNLGIAIRAQGRYEEAEKLFRDTLERERRVLGEDHPMALEVMNQLANLYDSQGRYAEAEAIDLQILEKRRRILGDQNHETLSSYNNLGNIYLMQGRYAEAESMYRKALEGDLRTVGPDHPDTTKVYYNLACLAALQGDRAQALRRLDEAVSHGYSHWDVMMRDSDLAVLRGDPAFDVLVARAKRNPPR